MIPQRLSGWLVLVLLAGGPSWAGAQPSPGREITIEGERGYPLAFSAFGGPSGAEAADRLRDRLARSGRIRLSASAERSHVVMGKAWPDELEGRLLDGSGRPVLVRTYEGGDLEELVREFSDDIVGVITGRPGLASSRLAFVSDRSGHKEIYVCRPDGSGILQVTRDGSISVSPSLGPEGRQLAYTGYFQGYADIYLIDLETGRRLRVIAEAGTNTGAALSPSGDQLAFTMSHPGNPELFVAPASGGFAQRLTRNASVESSPSWSPDGRTLVYVSDESGRPQLYTVPRSGGTPTRLSTGFRDCFEPHWSPDGAFIAFTCRENGTHQVVLYDVTRKTARKLTHGTGSEQPVWGPDSRHLVYLEDNAIYLHDTESGVREPVLSGFGTLTELAWSR